MDKEAQEKIEQLRNELEALHREHTGEVWYWQDDGRDHLESLTCPVLIEAQELRDLLGYRKPLDKPRIVCLCGSTRFTNEMLIKQWWFTKYGFIVLSWCTLPESYFKGEDKTHIGDQEGVKEIVDEVHLHKIDLADEVFVINVNGYIGESTRREIDYAMKLGKPIKYLEE